MGTIARLSLGLWRLLSSTRLAAILMAALLLASVLASLFPQIPLEPAAREPWLAAVTLRYQQATPLLHALGLLDAYHASWYLALLAALLLNTLACTVQRLPGLWQSLSKVPIVTRPEAFYRSFTLRSEWPVPALQAGLAAAQKTLRLRQHRYRLHVERDDTATCAYVYAERGNWAQTGTIVSHVAALFLVIALAARPALGWQQTGVTLLPGQPHTPDSASHVTVRAGPLIVERHASGQPRDYQVPLAVLVDGAPVTTQTVRINHPLTSRGVAFHLQSYGPAVQVVAPEGTFQLALTGGQAQEVSLPATGSTLRIAPQPEGGSLFVEVLRADGTTLGSGSVTDGQQIQVQGKPITFTLSTYTVWQVSHDPTFGMAVGAAGFLLLGTLVSLWVPRRRLWLRIEGQQAQMVGMGDFAGAFDGAFEALAGEIAASSVENLEVVRTDSPVRTEEANG